MKVWARRALVGGALLLVIVVAGLSGALAWMHRPRPVGTPGLEADELARSLYLAVDGPAWEQTGAVAWTFGGFRSHLWDRKRGYLRVVSGDSITMLRLDHLDGIAWRAGSPLSGDARKAALEDAWAAFCNDSFWLNPVVKVFDEGTTRGVVSLDDGRRGLLITYSSGGVTPGDSYLWIPGADGRPDAWRMWVSVIPVGGVRTTWEGWQRLPTGAWVSTLHTWDVGWTTAITDLRAGATLADIEPGVDPFAPLETPP